MSRPESVAGLMDELVAWLDLADRAFNLLAAYKGDGPVVSGRGVQGDLQMIAVWLREHPEIDAQMHAVLSVAP